VIPLHVLDGKIERKHKLIRSYEGLLEYWRGPRIRGSSARLNQTDEFIAHQLMSCRYELDKVERQLEQLTVLRVKVVAKMQEEAAR
jgi:hypothetical protein